MSWEIIEQTTQAGGEQRVQVEYTDDLMRKHRRSYDFPNGSDVAKEIQIREAHVLQGLKDQDIDIAVRRIESGAIYKLDYAADADLKLKLQETTITKQAEIDKTTAEKAKIDDEISAKGA